MKPALTLGPRLLLVALFVAVGTTAAGASAPLRRLATSPQHDSDPRDIAPLAKISLGEAIQRALKAVPGKAVEAELEGKTVKGKTTVMFEIKVVTDAGELHEIGIDPTSGEVRSNENATDEDEIDELHEFRTALRHAELSLSDLIGKAGEVIKGTAVKAALEFDDGSPQCELVIVNSRYIIEADLEARAGHLVDLELRRDGQGHEQAHGGKGGEGDEEGGSSGDEDDEAMEEKDEKGGDERPAPKKHERRAKEEADEDDEKDEAKPEHAQGAMAAPSTHPLADKVAFSPKVTHPFLPLSEVRYAEFSGGGERVVCKVLDETAELGGVTCLVLVEEEYEGKDLKEISRNYFAQDAHGTVYYFGEDVDEYKDGKVASHGGSWKVGTNAKEPCVFMPAHLARGLTFKAENSPPDAEEFDEVIDTDATVDIGGKKVAGVLVIREGDKPGEWKEKKFYARGVGLISENLKLNLVKFAPHAPSAK